MPIARIRWSRGARCAVCTWKSRLREDLPCLRAEEEDSEDVEDDNEDECGDNHIEGRSIRGAN